jgi:hypothetical protein
MKTISYMFGLMFGLCGYANADLLVNLSPSEITGKQWSILTFRAMLTNSGTERIYLNGMNFSELGEGLVLNSDIFFESGPAFLEGDESWVGDIFDVYVDATAPIGQHTAVVTWIGGNDEQAMDTLSTQYFKVIFQPTLDSNNNNVLDLPDLVFFAESWLANPCNEENSWCDERDIDHLGSVGLEDFQIIAQAWLRNDDANGN